jgi:hypothetical protein
VDNVPYGDRDSVGLFQQRPSQGWGTPGQLLNPTYSATAFYQRLITTPQWLLAPPGDVAQSVQRSAYPERYAERIAEAAAIHDTVTGAGAGAGADSAGITGGPGRWCPATASVACQNVVRAAVTSSDLATHRTAGTRLMPTRFGTPGCRGRGRPRRARR